jgi:transposase
MIPMGSKVHVALKPEDMRKSFNGLSVAVRNELAADPMSGHLFVFMNKQKDMVKTLWWHRGGYCIFSRRLEKGRFKSLIHISEGKSVEINGTELMMLLEGIDLSKVKLPRVWEAAG